MIYVRCVSCGGELHQVKSPKTWSKMSLDLAKLGAVDDDHIIVVWDCKDKHKEAQTLLDMLGAANKGAENLDSTELRVLKSRTVSELFPQKGGKDDG